MEGYGLKMKAAGGHFDPEAFTLLKPQILLCPSNFAFFHLLHQLCQQSNLPNRIHPPLSFPLGLSSLPAGSHLACLPTALTLAPSLCFQHLQPLSLTPLICSVTQTKNALPKPTSHTCFASGKSCLHSLISMSSPSTLSSILPLSSAHLPTMKV